ncbi:MAG: beta-N-acetylhexosaminidase [Deltaproteobacteria bacterium]|nr:beta-N-acetylhexosaminidase [Deltaproteobacteria bacterium]
MNPTLDFSELNSEIGSLFMSGMPGTILDKGTETLIREHSLGGIILFSRNIEDPVQLFNLCKALQEAASNSASGEPLFIAVDQEGGRVARLKEPFAVFPGNAAIGDDEDPESRAEKYALTTATEMNLAGLNMNLAPVMDVRRGIPESHLIGRTFSDDPEKVARLGCRVIEVLQSNGILAVAKHFPGLGRTSMDPHHHLPVIDLEESELEDINLLPFRAAIAEGVAGIMSSHAIYPKLDEEYPSTLSRRTLLELLRKRLGFKGLIITDDLEMGAIKKKWGVPEGVLLSFGAGADIFLICKDQKTVLESMLKLRNSILCGENQVKRLHQSIERISRAKANFLKPGRIVSEEKLRAYFSI